MNTRIALAAVPAALLAAMLAGSAPAAGVAGQAGTAVHFKDAPGDSGAAPDVTDVEVGNDVVAGPIVFWVTLANRTELVDGDAVLVLLDTDHDASTGDPDGFEYVLGVAPGEAWVARWDGTDFVDAEAPSLRVAFYTQDKALRLSIHPSELGGTRSFAFWVLTFAGEEHADLAPNGPPLWSYQLASGRPALGVMRFALAPKAPAAGKQVSARMTVGRADINEVLVQGKVTCALKVGKASIKAFQGRFVQGVATCAWRLPKTAKGQLARGTVSVTFGGSTVKRAFSARVR